uniref:Uncharacterized protein n=1 Tax=Pristionchus pacificus TaxID=54126 RepID=A0A2A6BKV8_PRIPA|eukprot:PDM66552.1 hypothetical protein PRIPAC_47969 [Pristionchus pacificus]
MYVAKSILPALKEDSQRSRRLIEGYARPSTRAGLANAAAIDDAFRPEPAVSVRWMGRATGCTPAAIAAFRCGGRVHTSGLVKKQWDNDEWD